MSEAPNTSQRSRQYCYAVRDAYFACLDANNDDKTVCKPERLAYKDGCMKSWRKYFDERRKMRKPMLEGLVYQQKK